jgi:WD40 repeat protein
LDFSLDGAVLVTAGSSDRMVKFWCTKTWQMQGESIKYDPDPNGNPMSSACVRYSPSGKLLAITIFGNIGIYNPGTRECVISFNADYASSLTWTPDGTRLLSGSYGRNPTIREWDTTTWKQVGHPWEGHTGDICAIAIHPAGTLVASASIDKHVRLWRLSDRRTITIFQHSAWLESVAFSADGKHILSAGDFNKISEWAVPNSKVSLRS